MLSTRDIKRKIRTVQNIQQICRAMKTVSSIKLRKAEERINAARPYATAMRELVATWEVPRYRIPCWRCARYGVQPWWPSVPIKDWRGAIHDVHS